MQREVRTPLQSLQSTASLQLLKWFCLALVTGALAGTASAVFLSSLSWVTQTREANLWLIALLPLAGLVVGGVYHYFGQEVRRGNDLLLDEIHETQKTIPVRMAPFALLGTLATHLFGGSAGREGTALQMGASLADQLSAPLRLTAEDRRIILMAGVSGGFGSVFGTPLAGAVFGLEFVAIGRVRYHAIFPCFVASIAADYVTTAWGVGHTHYHVPFVPDFTLVGLLAAIGAGIAFGLAAMTFAKMTHGAKALFAKMIKYPPMRPVVGGAIVAFAVWLLGTTRYIGLGIPTIVESFTTELPPWDFAAKLVFTAVTLGAGFQGGEVTPLFYVGSTLGSALSPLLPFPTPVLAAMGFVAVWCAAANTPLAGILMAIELFGPEIGVYASVACVVSYLFSGHTGIYTAQRIDISKNPNIDIQEGMTVSELERSGVSRVPKTGDL